MDGPQYLSCIFMTDFRFPADSTRARRIDLGMRCLLGESLDYIAGQIHDQLSFDRASLARLATALKAGQKLPPSTFALYTELVIALTSGDNARAEDLLAELAREKPLDTSARIVALDSPHIAAQSDRLVRLMDSDPEVPFPIRPPQAEAGRVFEARLRRSMDLMSRAIPELAGEIDALVSQIIMVTGDATSNYVFDGGSTYMMWGGLFLNVDSHENEIALLEVLAHESAHMLLFGFCRDEALVNNPDDERYPSPLRVDLRPMDGIFHATFVSARMHWAMSKLLDSGLLSPSECEFAVSSREADQKNFEAGYFTVHRHGDLTPTGRALMQSAREYMDTVRQPAPDSALSGA